jgi:hypothetical protein
MDEIYKRLRTGERTANIGITLQLKEIAKRLQVLMDRRKALKQ